MFVLCQISKNTWRLQVALRLSRPKVCCHAANRVALEQRSLPVALNVYSPSGTRPHRCSPIRPAQEETRSVRQLWAMHRHVASRNTVGAGNCRSNLDTDRNARNRRLALTGGGVLLRKRPSQSDRPHGGERMGWCRVIAEARQSGVEPPHFSKINIARKRRRGWEERRKILSLRPTDKGVRS